MGIALPQLAPASEDRVSGVPSFDGGFRFTSTGKGHLAKIPSVCGNRQRWTWSGWIKKSGQTAAQQAFMSAAENPGGSISNDYQVFYLWDNATSNSYWRAQPGSANSAQTSALFRDNAGWYHLVCVSDITQSSAVNRMKIYVNGELQSLTTNWSSAQNEDTAVNGSGYEHGLGISIQDGDKFYDGIMAQVDFVDGRVVGPEEFAFTDPLTGTWRPKRHKLTGPNDGTVWSANCTSSTPSSGTVIADFFRGSTGSCEGLSLASGGNIVLTKDILNVTNIGIYSNTGSSFTLTVNEGEGDEYTATVNSRNNVSILDEFTGFSGTLHTLKLSGFGAGTCLNGIAINGVMLIDGDTKNIGANGYYLPMDGNSSVGEDKSGITTPNNGTVWSQYLTGSGNNFYVGAQGISKAFDGKTGTYVQQQNTSNPNSITFTPPGGIPHSSKVEVWISNTANKVSYNGGSLQTMSSGWNTVASGSGTLTTLRFERASTSGTAVRAIRIDGHQLIDGVKGNSWKPELCGSVSVDKATGALPILNTGNGGAVARPGVLGSEVSKNYTVTVASVDGQNKYAIDGVDRPSPTLHRGGTYTFDYTAATSHPFYLSSLPDGKHNSKAYSVSFDGTDDRLSVGTSSDYAFGTGDFTIEMFVRHTSLTGQQTYFSDAQGDNDGVYFYKTSTNTLSLYDNNNQVFSAGTIELNKWTHIALSRYRGTVRAFINGTLVANVVDSHDYTETQYNIGDSHGSSSGEMVGHISNVRVLKGTGLYTSDFTPPTTTLTNITNTVLLCCQDSNATTAAVIPSSQSITAVGNASATNDYNPFLYDNNHGNFGLNTSTSNVTKITIPHLAADSLYYYCQQHPNMGNTTAMSVITDVQKADPYAWKCVYALPLIGSNQDVSNQINCTMSAAKAVASNGDAGPTSATSNFYSGSFDLDGNGDYLQTAYDADFSFLNQDFTAECWVNTTQTGAYGTTIGRWTSTSSTAVWDLRAASADYGNRFIFITRNGSGTGYFVDSGVNVNDGLWHHLAVCRQGQYLMVFVDGTMVTIEAMYHTVNDNTSKAMTVGYGDGSNYMDGQVQDVRVYKGVAKYTESFVVGSASPDAFIESPSGVAVKSQLKKITDGAVSIRRPSDQYLQAPASTDFRLDGQYCIEYFLNLTDYSNDSVYVRTFILDGPTGDGGSTNIHLNVNPSTGVLLFWSGSSELIGGTISIAGGWHHVCLTRDSSNKTRLFIDGVLSGSADITTDYNLNSNQNRPRLGALGTTGGTTGHYSNWRIIKGSIPTEYQTSTTTNGTRAFSPPTSALTNVTNTKLLCCQSTTSATAAAVTPGSITANGTPQSTTFNPFITNINTVRGQEGAYCTWNPLYPSFATTSLSNGNLDSSLRYTNGANTPYSVGTVAVSSGKWYWEITLTQESNDTEYIGFIDGSKTSGAWVFADIGAYFSDARKAISTTPSSYGTNYTTGDVIGVALDADNGDIEFYKNGVSQGVAASGMTGFNSYRPFTSANGGSTAQLVSANFGQKPYKFPPPDGYQTLTSSVLRPETVITRPDKYFNTVIYTGTGTEKSLDVGFKPDFSFFGIRNDTGYIKYLFDSVRGATKYLATSHIQSEYAQGTDAQTLKTFDSNGVTIGTNGQMNQDAKTYVSWHWKAGGAPTATNSNTSGAMAANSVIIDDVLQSAYTPSGSPTIYPKKMSIGTKQGFSIINYNGVGDGSTETIPHGLSQAPDFAMIKNMTSGSTHWAIYHGSDGTGATFRFTRAAKEGTSMYGNADPTNTLITLKENSNRVNNTSQEYICYAWHNVPGMQKFGKYIGNGALDGNFIELGFRPALIWIKPLYELDAGSSNQAQTGWYVYDNKRRTFNPNGKVVGLNNNFDEDDDATDVDFLSNGFKLRNQRAINTSSGAIYMAWAESPQFNLFGAQSSAR